MKSFKWVSPHIRSRGRKRPANLSFELVEDRVLLATFTVTNNADSGPGSLRQAILYANTIPGKDTINFDIGAISEAPAITSAATTTFTVGTAGTFTVTATGVPTPTLTETGALPGGVTFVDNHDGTATFAGTPAAAGPFPLTITAANGVVPDATQTFTLTVAPAPAAPIITSTSHHDVHGGHGGHVHGDGYRGPDPTLTETGALPGGVTFVNNGDGTATLAGTPAPAGTFPLTITAANGVIPNATQTFTLTVIFTSPGITSAELATLIGRVTVSSSGLTIRPSTPLPPITEPVTIDGTTQPGFAGTPIIELDGTGAGATANGLTLSASNIIVRGLVINRFGGDGIEITGSAHRTTRSWATSSARMPRAPPRWATAPAW